MKIINDVHRQRDTSYARQAPTETKSFQHSLQSQYLSQKKQELDNMMKNISLQGEKLARSRNFKELAKFKKMIKSFLGETVSGGLRIKKEQSFNRNGSNHLTLIKQVDEKLIELTEQIMSQEKKTVDILGLIGEIKGLLINIYI
ncbi:YaaR family protein [Oceanobacillus sp. Castelsardo]|uniref:YaaR family protein n=1 Tax=Oceanobacillus sp. Castelsardo TaxID=1851204 RepID=UPI000838C866|nr:YaaR family protein [Oceanobacillus sp. Castelsardo]